MGMDAPPLTPPAPAYQDRSTGLVVFGVFAIIIGAVCGLLVPLAVLGQLLAARRLGTEFDSSAAFTAAAIYGLLAAALITLGIGSIRARRWARALLLCLGWIGLIAGLVALPVIWLAMNNLDATLRAQGQSVHASSLALIKIITLCTTFVIYIVIPLVAVLFYSRRNVRLTCEARDPVERWTDRCPLPVLALCVVKAWSALLILLMLPTYGRVFPLYGMLAEGWPARLLWLGMVAFLAYTIRGFYRLDLRAWWIYVAGSVALWASSMVTLQRIGLAAIYRSMGLPERQIALTAHNPLLQGNTLLWLSLVSVVVWYAYLVSTRRFFRPVTNPPAAA